MVNINTLTALLKVLKFEVTYIWYLNAFTESIYNLNSVTVFSAHLLVYSYIVPRLRGQAY